MRIKNEIVKADKGFYVLEPILDEKDDVCELRETPIIAWLVEIPFEREDKLPIVCCYPITMEGLNSDNDIIKRPDGLIEVLGSVYFSGNEHSMIKAALEYAQEKHERLKQRRNKNANSPT